MTIKLKFYADDTKPGGTKFDYDLYFKNNELALEYLNVKMPGHEEITEEVKQPWFTNYTTRTFKYEAKRYDEQGDLDYPVLFKVEMDEIKIIESSEGF